MDGTGVLRSGATTMDRSCRSCGTLSSLNLLEGSTLLRLTGQEMGRC